MDAKNADGDWIDYVWCWSFVWKAAEKIKGAQMICVREWTYGVVVRV